MSERTLLIVNPVSGGGGSRARVDALVARTAAVFGSLDVAVTQGPGDATRLAQAAADGGVARLLVAGGDGTVGEVVSGLLMRADVGAAGRPSLALLPIGTGCDLARSLGIPRQLGAALEIAAAGALRPLDVARIRLRDRAGAPVERYFANEASAGLSGETVARVGGRSGPLGPRVAFVAAALEALAHHRPFDAALEIDGVRIHEGPISLCAIANGRYFGAGMRVAPEAALDDGWLEVVLARGLSRRVIALNLPAFYLGRHGRHPAVSFHAGRCVELRPKSGEAAVEVDGEGGFRLPLAIECVPAALRIATPRATIPLARDYVRADSPTRALAPVPRPIALREKKPG